MGLLSQAVHDHREEGVDRSLLGHVHQEALEGLKVGLVVAVQIHS
jgi:hypothetical protein